MTAAKTPETKHRVLVVDDDRGMRESLSELLAATGYDVVTASNTDEALKVIASGDVDLLLTDLRMPGPNGLELIRSARQWRPDLRAILMTAFGNGFTEVEVVRRGGVGYLQKPFEADEVTGLVGRILTLEGA